MRVITFGDVRECIREGATVIQFAKEHGISVAKAQLIVDIVNAAPDTSDSCLIQL